MQCRFGRRTSGSSIILTVHCTAGAEHIVHGRSVQTGLSVYCSSQDPWPIKKVLPCPDSFHARTFCRWPAPVRLLGGRGHADSLSYRSSHSVSWALSIRVKPSPAFLARGAGAAGLRSPRAPERRRAAGPDTAKPPQTAIGCGRPAPRPPARPRRQRPSTGFLGAATGVVSTTPNITFRVRSASWCAAGARA